MGLSLEFSTFVKSHWKLFLVPVLIAAVLVVTLVLVTEDSAIAPFIYALF